MSTPNDSRGGAIAARGLLVQTLIALLDITKSEPPFSEITLEPREGDDQFDFLWKNASGSHGTQVKSTENIFTRADVVKWAKKLEAVRPKVDYTLVLVGNIHHTLVKVAAVGKVALKQKPLDLDGLIGEAAQRLAEFMESEGFHAGTAAERTMVVHAVASKLQHLSTNATALTRAAFIALLRQWITSAPKAGIRVDIGRILRFAPADLIGREVETAILDDAWLKVCRVEKGRTNVLTFVALGGEGKTSLVAKWAADLAAQDWPGCDAVFAWSFYSQGSREQTAVSSDLFLAEALTFFGDEAMARSAVGAHEKGKRLADLIGQRRSLLILDGLEPLQYAPTSPTPGELKDHGLAALLKGLAATSHGLCVVTTRYALPDLRAFLGKTAREEKLLRLSRAAGVKLLKAHGVTGSDRPNLPHTDDDGKNELLSEFEKLVEDVDGHALTLHLMGSFLKRAFHGDIRRRDRVTFARADEKTDNGHAFRAMAAYEKWMGDGSVEARRELAILSLLGLFDRPATADCLHALLQAPAIVGLTEPLVGLPEEDWNGSLTALQDAQLLTVNRDAAGTLLSLDAHPLLREYFAIRLRSPTENQAPTGRNATAQGNALGSESKNADSPEGAAHDADVPPLQGLGDSGTAVPGALPQAVASRPVGAQTSAAWREAHRRIYDHLCATTKEWDQPTLEDLQPLYQAVAHGCQAGLQQEAFTLFDKRIGRLNEKYPTRKLGAFGSDLGGTACFFEAPWSRLSPALSEATQAWLLNKAAFCLRALGRLTEALEPMRVSGEVSVNVEDWNGAARSFSNLSELELTLGEVAGAVRAADQSVTYADRSGEALLQVSNRTTHADVLHQAGRRAEAVARFREAEKMQAECQPAYALLYSLWGFRYCDLLLTEVERGKAEGRRKQEELLAVCRAVSERAAKMFEWRVASDSLLTIALDHLILGRAGLYAAILSSDFPPPSSFVLPTSHLDTAVSGLRRAGMQDHLPRGLLTRAWLRSLTGARTGPESAQSDLDEAWEIAARGPMPLFLADIHLYRARLFFREAHYPFTDPDGTPRTPQQDLAEARRLITKHGYLRRKEELEDAEAAIRSFQPGATP